MLAIVLALSIGQLPQAPPVRQLLPEPVRLLSPDCVCQVCDCDPCDGRCYQEAVKKYNAAYVRALVTRKPFIVCVDCEGEGYRVTSEFWKRITGVTFKGFVVASPRGNILEWKADLPPSATPNDIERVLTPVQEVTQSRRPFSGKAWSDLHLTRIADDEGEATGPWPKGEPFPKGLVRYESAKYTQSIFRLNDVPTIRPVHRSGLLGRWRVPGGMEGVEFRSTLYKYVPVRESNWRGMIPVLNSFGYFQNELGNLRSYPDGTVFVDVLSNADGRVFEQRVREKDGGEWKSYVHYRDRSAYPKGYAGLKGQTCIECHQQAGTGGYGVGLVPGGDGVISDKIPALEP